MLNLTLKNVPPVLHARLKASAAANHRSLNREILARLAAQLDAPPVDVVGELRALEAFVASIPEIDHAQVRAIMAAAEAGLAGREHHLPGDRVFEVVERSRLSAYDAEFVALAGILDARLVTEDREILAVFAGLALMIEQALIIQ